VRKKRPTGLRFSVGQVVRHLRLGFKAVVIGWDESACAPATWMALHYPKLERELEVRGQPNYRLLADMRDTLNYLGPLYVPQDELVVLSKEDFKAAGISAFSNEPIVKHPAITEFFDFYDGKSFTPRPWLRRIYPQG
uniref:YccV-like domain-containing protein n=2 Tax=Mesocestoides corti TaxID=53468 RepID=A0A5K3EX25_MESCO